jgi:MgtC family
MIMVAIGSTTYMLVANKLMSTDPSSVSRTLQGFLSGIGFLGGAVIFKSGFDVKGIKAAAAVWITGVMGRTSSLVPASPPLRLMVRACLENECRDCGLPVYRCESEGGEMLSFCAGHLPWPKRILNHS